MDADELRLRTKDGHNNNDDVVEQYPSQATTSGIRYVSPFSSGSFHVVNGLSPDIMHVFLEDVIPFDYYVSPG